ncbi:MAG: hypothetical protein R3F56_08820 [Planctomycetota bacterium]
MVRRAAWICLFAVAGCTLPETVENLERENPPAALGRPGFVRVGARAGAWIGGAVGGVASIVLLPVTYPLSLLAECPLGYSQAEFRWAPASMGAAAGHWAIGAPLDVLHYVFYRAWTGDSCEPAAYEFVPMPPPVGPGVPPVDNTAADKN